MSFIRKNRRVLMCENLESRELLSVAAALVGTQLNIDVNGSSSAFVRFDGTNYVVATTSGGAGVVVTGGPSTAANTTAIAVTGAAAGNESVTLEGPNNLVLTGALTVDNLIENATVNQAISFGSVALNANTLITIGAATTSTAGDITLNAGPTGSILDSAALDSSADVALLSGDVLAIGGTISALGDDVRLVGGTGITQTQLISAGNLSARTIAGDVVLNSANLVTGNFAASSAGSVSLNNADLGNLTVGDVTAGPTGFTAVTGVTSASFTMIITSGMMRISNPVSAGGDVNLKAGDRLAVVANISATGAFVRLAAGTGIGETSVITATGLSATSTAGSVNLIGNNLVASFFAANAQNGLVNFINTSAGTSLVIGSVAASGLAFAQVDGVTAVNGDIAIVSANQALAIQQIVQASTDRTVRLNFGGNVTETLVGKIVAGSLLVRSIGGQINLATDSSDSTTLVDNLVTNLAAESLTAARYVKFYTSGGLNISTVLGTSLVVGLAGVRTANVTDALGSGNISLRAANELTVSSDIRTGNVTSSVGNAVSGSIRLQAADDIMTTGGASIRTGNAQVSTLPGRTSQIGSIGIQTDGSVSNAGNTPLELRIGVAGGAVLASSNKVGQLAIKALGNTQVVNRTAGIVKLGAVAADTVVFIPGITDGNITIV